MLEDGDFAEYREERRELYPWLLVYLKRFNRQKVNQRLQHMRWDRDVIKQRIL
jgi:hypothetical protein